MSYSRCVTASSSLTPAVQTRAGQTHGARNKTTPFLLNRLPLHVDEVRAHAHAVRTQVVEQFFAGGDEGLVEVGLRRGGRRRHLVGAETPQPFPLLPATPDTRNVTTKGNNPGPKSETKR